MIRNDYLPGDRRLAAVNDAKPLIKDHGFVIVNEDSVVEVETDGLGEDGFFKIPAFADQVRDVIAMVDTDDVLVDDGAFVKVGCRVVGGGTD